MHAPPWGFGTLVPSSGAGVLVAFRRLAEVRCVAYEGIGLRQINSAYEEEHGSDSSASRMPTSPGVESGA